MYKELVQVKSIDDIKCSFEQPEEYYFLSTELESVKNKNKIKSLGARYLIKMSILDFLNLKNEFHNIEIWHGKNGKPFVKFTGKVKESIAEKNIQNVHISISHSRNFISTLVVFE